jgi:inner membrane protein
VESITVYSITHVAAALTVSILLVLDMPFVVFGAVLPDIDQLLPVAHRTFFHSLLFGLVITAFAHWKFGKRASMSLFIGFFSHLALDAITPMGVTFLYPYMKNFSFNLVASGDPIFNLGITAICGVLLANQHTIIEKLNQIPPVKIRRVTFGFIAFFSIALLLAPQHAITCEGSPVTISSLITNQGVYDGVQVITNGTVCSEIDSYTSYAGNLYQIFDLCDGDSVEVWKLYDVDIPYFSEDEEVELCGTFTLDYSTPEINYIIYLRSVG